MNAALTVRCGAPNSHAKYWWRFTNEIIKALGARDQEKVFVLWGIPAKTKRKWVADGHCVIESSHPSPLSARHSFEGSRPFSRANEFLESKGQKPIDWRLPEA